MYSKYIKRILDLSGALFGLIVVSPVFLTVFLILSIANKGQPFFVQTRPGKNGKPFQIIKFRTMNDKRDDVGDLLPSVERITHIGKIIRESSIDELPQIINVLRGDMSIIGPRPLLMDYLPLYSKEQVRRHLVRPGITGWAQINGRNSITWSEKFLLDTWYVDNLSFLIDLKIIFLSIQRVLRRKDINKNVEVTMEKFDGSN